MTDNNAHLYSAALDADAAYSAACEAAGGTRWTLTAVQKQTPTVRDAYRAKLAADLAWLATFALTPDVERRTALLEADLWIADHPKGASR